MRRARSEMGRAASAVVVVLAYCAMAPSADIAGLPRIDAAHANTYSVYVCDPSAGAASVDNAMQYSANDYVNLASGANCNQPSAGNPKGSGDGLQVWSHNGTAGGGHAGGWWFEAPADTSIVGLAWGGEFSAWGGWVSHWSTQSDGSDDLGGAGIDCGSTSCNTGPGEVATSVAVNDASQVGFAAWCHASTCPANSSSSTFGPAASANVFFAQITVNEQNEPSLSASGNLWAANGQWTSGVAAPPGGWTLNYGGSDPAGVCVLHPLLVNSAGGWVQWDFSNDWSPDFTQPSPCGPTSRGYSWSPALGSLANGLYYLHVQATNPADVQNGNNYVADAAIPLYIDNQPPPPVTGLAANSAGMGPLGWSSSRSFTLSWTGQADYPGPQSPITTTNVSIGGVSSWQQSASQNTATASVGSAAGAYSASVWEQDQAGNQASPQSVALYYDPNAPSAPAFGPARPGWIGSSEANVSESLSASAGGPSGVYGYAVSVDGQPSTDWHQATVHADGAGNATFALSSLPDGVHQLCAIAFSGAGVGGPEGCTTIRIDRQPPATTISTDTPQSATAWVNHAVTLTASCADQSGLSGCESVSYQLDGGAVQTVNGSSASVVVSSSGAHTLRAWSSDNAGNVGQAVSSQSLVDVGAPSGAFDPQQPTDPQQLAVAVADPYSGVAGGQIQLQINGVWTSLSTSYDDGTGLLTAVAADDQLPKGSWAARAIVWNAVGNQAIITSYANGTAVTHSVPARVQTVLRIGEVLTPQRECTTRVVAVRSSHRRSRVARNQRRPARLRRRCVTRLVPKALPVDLSSPRPVTLRGVLETAAGQPVVDASVQTDFTADGWTIQKFGLAMTDNRGQFSYQLPAGGSGVVSVVFGGTDTLSDATSNLATQVRGQIVAQVALLQRAGSEILHVSGRMVGGYIPRGGVQIQPEYIELGQPTTTWAPFGSPIYTASNGAWSHDIPISPAAHGHAYRLRFVVNHQAGWPFGATTSRVFVRSL